MKCLNIIICLLVLISTSFEKAVDNDEVYVNNISDTNSKKLTLNGLWSSTEQSKPLSSCVGTICVMPMDGFSWNIIFNGGSCEIHSITAGALDYITNKGAKNGSLNAFIDMNGILRCRFKGVVFDYVQKVNIKGSMMNTSQSYFITTAIELYHINIDNQVLMNGANVFSRNGLTLTITLGDCDSTWSYGVTEPNNCNHSSWVIGDSRGQCGQFGNAYYFCKEGQCCSKYGYCGVSTEYCSVGCQPLFGLCQKY